MWIDLAMRRVALLLLVPLLLCCGGAAAGGAAKPSSPFTAQDARVFDEAVDLLADPESLEGAWADSWRRDLDTCTGRADVVSVVSVETIVADIDPQGRKTFRLVPVPVRGLRGALPTGTSLRVRQDSPGYASVESNREALTGGQYLLFVKWYRTDDGHVLAHWHLAQATPPVVEIVEGMLGLREPAKRRVVIHRE